ncbi:uncharacterized protein [Lolium perenne]|uniref:uncharacterized protein n=1 Tax=Lolium perenne TaxID=4522 RepID=UPI0021F5F114|nr:uncharacterized protein LOC127346763 [Lolium perenne]
MPFGLKNAGATYQKMMQTCLATQIGKNIQVYIEDVVITTKTGSSLTDDLRETFDNLNKLSNDEADVLAHIGSQCLPIPPGVFREEISERSTKAKKTLKQPKKKEKAKKDSGAPAAQETHISDDEEEPEEVMMIEVPWMQVYVAYITRKEIPQDPVEARGVIRRSKAFTVVKGELYKRSISGVL